MRISDWSSDVCSSDLSPPQGTANLSGGVDVRSTRPRGTATFRIDDTSTIGSDTIVLATSRESVGPVSMNAIPNSPPIKRLTIEPAESSVSRQSRRSEEHTSELQSLMRNSYAVFCLKK